MDLVSVKLLQFEFLLRRLTFREEFGISGNPGRASRRSYLATALSEVRAPGKSPLVISSLDQALEALAPVPPTILDRVWIIYRGSGRENVYFSTRGLYTAPTPAEHSARVSEEDKAVDDMHDPLFQTLVDKYGPEEAAEAENLQQKVLANAKKASRT